ncbi:MAG: DUF4340 domain-containing protein [Candidatus Alcyoniella australis]|nr:DUF4340 domain-containing protein [Candidatus Alcyoniella australis]
MKIRVLIALIVVAALAGLTYYLSQPADVQPEPTPVQGPERLLSLDPEAVRHIEIARGQSAIELQLNDEEQWLLVKPVAAAADQTVVRSLVNTLRYMGRPEPIVDAGELEQFGLGQDAAVLTLDDGQSSQSISFGDRAPLDRGIYVFNHNDQRVYLVPPEFERYLVYGAIDFRDRRVFPVAPDQLVEIKIERGRRLLERCVLSKADGTWRVVEPFPALADGARLVSLANLLTRLQVERYLEQDEARPMERALRRPDARLSISATDDAGRIVELRTSLLIRDDQIIARPEGADQTYALKADALDKILVNSVELADRGLLSPNLESVERIDLQFPQQSIRLSRSEGEFVSESDEFTVDPHKVRSLLDSLQLTSWAEPVGPAVTARSLRRVGLNRPDLEVVLYDAEGNALAHLKVGRPLRGQRRVSLGDPPYIYLLQPDSLAGLASSVADLALIERAPEATEESHGENNG